MTKGEEIFNKYIAKRDYTGSEKDDYAQLLTTLFFHIGEEIYKLIELAENENKKLQLRDNMNSSEILWSDIQPEDIIFV